MTKRSLRLVLALTAAAALLLSACVSGEKPALTWGIWGNYSRHADFLDLLHETCPDIQLEFLSYGGNNSTAYSWVQMRAGDIPDIFITSQILDEDLAREQLIDLSNYPFINNLPTAVLDQVEIDGGLYLLPASYSMYGILYNKTLMEEHNWTIPGNFDELEALCAQIRAEGLIPGVLGTQLTGNCFSAVFNLAKTSWLTTPEGSQWEADFLSGNASAQDMWAGTMDYVQRYIDIGMFYTDPEDRNNPTLILDYLGSRKAVFCTAVQTVNITALPDTGDELGMIPYISEDGSKNVYMYSPSCYFGISRRLAEPGNEEKLEEAVQILSLLFSPEGQSALISANAPCVMSALNNAVVPENALIYDAQQALRDGRAFPMTYVGWENVLADIGLAFKEWFRGENGMDGAACIARMDELQRTFLEDAGSLYFCESTADFTLEETARLVARALGCASGADAVLVSLNEFHEGGLENYYGIGGKLYAGPIDSQVASTLLPSSDGEYALMTMTGAQAKQLAQAGFDLHGDGNPFPYLLVTRDGAELEDSQLYQVAFLKSGYTEQTAQEYSAQAITASLHEILFAYLEEQGTVSPDGSP